ncbi:hypothetical protein SODG_004281 [Sodalis praecaptivus]
MPIVTVVVLPLVGLGLSFIWPAIGHGIAWWGT